MQLRFYGQEQCVTLVFYWQEQQYRSKSYQKKTQRQIWFYFRLWFYLKLIFKDQGFFLVYKQQNFVESFQTFWSTILIILSKKYCPVLVLQLIKEIFSSWVEFTGSYLDVILTTDTYPKIRQFIPYKRKLWMSCLQILMQYIKIQLKCIENLIKTRNLSTKFITW